MVAEPAAAPVTVIEEPEVLEMVAIVPAVVLQVPPLVASVNVVVAPVQTVDEPVIVPAVGVVCTVTERVATAVPQPFVTL